jgi:type III secretion protein T
MNQSLLITELTDLLLPWAAAWALLSTRFLGFAMVFPLFSWLALPMILRFAFAGALGLPIAGLEMSAQFAGIKLISSPLLAILVAKEFAIGAGLGLVAGMPFWAAQSGGELIDTYRGSSAGQLFDPSQNNESSEFGITLMLAALALLVWSGGFPKLIGIVFFSYGVWPPLDLYPSISLDAAPVLAQQIGRMLSAAMGIAATTLSVLLVADLALGMMSRATRKFEVFELSLNVKNLAFVLLMPALILPMLFLIQRHLQSLDGLYELLRSIRG